MVFGPRGGRGFLTNAYKRLHRGRAACVWHCRTACFMLPYGPFGIVIRPVLQGKTTAAVSGCSSGCYVGAGLAAFSFTLPAALRACGGMALLCPIVAATVAGVDFCTCFFILVEKKRVPLQNANRHQAVRWRNCMAPRLQYIYNKTNTGVK